MNKQEIIFILKKLKRIKGSIITSDLQGIIMVVSKDVGISEDDILNYLNGEITLKELLT